MTFLLASVALAFPHPGAHCAKTFTVAMDKRAIVSTYDQRPNRPVTHAQRARLRRYSACLRLAVPPGGDPHSPAALHALRYLGGVRVRAEARRAAARLLQARAARESAGYSSSDLGDVPGVPYSFAKCVAYKESTDGAGSPNIYGILPSNGYFNGMSLAGQKRLFSEMYARSGVSPWAPYDGC